MSRRDSQGAKGGTLDKMPYFGEREVVETTSCSKTEHQVEGWSCDPIVKNSDPGLFLSERTEGTNMEKSLTKRKSSHSLNLGSISRGSSKA